MQRTEFYRQDFEILSQLGHDVVFINQPLRLSAAFDVAFVWWWNHLFAWGPIAKLRKLPIITTGVFDVTTFPEWPLWKRTLKAVGARLSDLNIFVSKFESERVTGVVRMAQATIRYSPCVVDTAVYRPPSVRRATQAFEIANIALQTVGNAQRKMVYELLEAFARLAGEAGDATLTLAGPPGDGTLELQQQARSLGVADRVSFPGELTRDQKVDVMQRCSLYCQVSRYEGFGLATAEAMSCGAPVVVSRVGAVPEVVGDAGFYVNDLTVSAIERVLRERLRARHETDAVRTRARERIVEHFSVERRLGDLRRFIAEVV